MAEERILLVDDEPNVLMAFARRLRPRFPIETLSGPAEALEAVRTRGPFAVVISDLKMPQMNGVELLTRIREEAPDTVRMILTGYADVDTAIRAVNEGNAFRFLTKPCPAGILEKAITAALDQYRLIRSERELLEETLRGSIRVLTELLCLLKPEAFERSTRIGRWASAVARTMGVQEVWKIETAALLSHIGWVTLPDELMNKTRDGQDLTAQERQLFERHPLVASNLLGNIPRMADVAEIIRLQGKRYDGSGTPEGPPFAEEIPVGARILKALLDFDALTDSGRSEEEALEVLCNRPGWYDPMVLAALDAVLHASTRYVVRAVTLEGLAPGMILADDVRGQDGVLLLAKGRHVSPPILERLGGVAEVYGIVEPLRVFVPLEQVLGGPPRP